MNEDTAIPGALNNVVRIDDERIKGHLDRVVRGTVEETLNALLDAEPCIAPNSAPVYAQSPRVSITRLKSDNLFKSPGETEQIAIRREADCLVVSQPAVRRRARSRLLLRHACLVFAVAVSTERAEFR